MDISLQFAIISFTTFITIINPLSVMPVFMTMTGNLEDKQKKKVAKKAVFTALLTMLVFAFAGQIIFKFFSITADSFRVVGGIIFFMMGWDMLQARLIRTKMDTETVREYVSDISITPLGIPMICGPGAITNSIVLMEDAKNIAEKIALVLVMVLILWITYIVLLGAGKITKTLGETGNKVLMRIMGLIVMVMAVEFFFSGLRPILSSIIFNVQ
jgi:multiple antibiotic resistance protein